MIKIIESIKERIAQFQTKNNILLEKTLEDLKILLKLAQSFEPSWSRSWMGYQANYYYQNFTSPPSSKYSFNIDWEYHQIPNTWLEVSYDQIARFIEQNNKDISIDKIQDILDPIVKDIQSIQRFILTELIVLQSDKKFLKESKELERLEKHRWGASFDDLISVQRPNNIITSNISAMQNGLRIPPHKAYETQVIVELSKIQSIQEFLTEVNTLIHKIEIRSNTSVEFSKEEVYSNLFKLFSRFHIISKQLRNRYGNRSTLKIEDEYDVQDLLHSLLKLFFDDIRPEEWTPSYCGGSSRMDFLIKSEQIVIEVKKTRPNLEDRQIGDQLLIDIAKYSQHPDCKTLICFVYDPEGRIGNPIGLEMDLSNLSNDKLKIIAIISPK